jgi:hypothetical protein
VSDYGRKWNLKNGAGGTPEPTKFEKAREELGEHFDRVDGWALIEQASDLVEFQSVYTSAVHVAAVLKKMVEDGEIKLFEVPGDGFNYKYYANLNIPPEFSPLKYHHDKVVERINARAGRAIKSLRGSSSVLDEKAWRNFVTLDELDRALWYVEHLTKKLYGVDTTMGEKGRAIIDEMKKKSEDYVRELQRKKDKESLGR